MTNPEETMATAARWRPSRTTLTVGRLVRVAPLLWEPASGLACAREAASAEEFVAAYVEAVACLAGSAGWSRTEAEARIDEAARLTGAELAVEDWRHLWRCYHLADPRLAIEYRVSTDGHHGAA